MTEKKEKTAITDLRVNHVVKPLAMDDSHPCFSWRMDSERCGARQTAYRLRVLKGTETVWDSGRVESSESVGIRYPKSAEALVPEEEYIWKLSVWDDLGEEVSAESVFSTGLMSRTIQEWHGAKWIGADEWNIAAETMPVFRIRYRMQIKEGGKSAGVIFGASDPRLNRATQNNYLIAGENYIAYSLNVSKTSVQVEVYRKGYAPGETGEAPAACLIVPESAVNEENRYQAHDYEIVISGNQMELMTVDGVPAEGPEEDRLILDNPRNPVKERTHLILNPLKKVLDVPIFPRLCSVGFITDENTEAEFTAYEIAHYGGERNVFFDEKTGAGYGIFAEKEGLFVDGGRITAAPGTLAYADPSHASLPMLRKEFRADRPVRSAKIYAAAQGMYELRLNGEKVGEEYLSSGDMDFSRRIFYTAFDVTPMIRKGRNAFGAILASGWFGDQVSYDIPNYNYYGDRQALLLLLAVKYADGSEEYIGSGEDWQYYGEGPVRYAGNFNGEIFDARWEERIRGWDEPGFDGKDWRAARLADAKVRGREPLINAKLDPGVFQTEELSAVYVGSETRGNDTVYLYDMGINMVGVPRITFPEGESGRQVTIRYAEIRYPNLSEDNPYYYGDLGGMILTENLRGALATDRYTMKGEKNEVFCPVFTFHGYRYVELSGIDAAIPAENIRGIVLSSVHPTARYESSNPLTNQLFKNIIRSTVGNFLSIPTDCPQRDERLGWAGDAQVYSETATYMADVAAFYRNYDLLQRDAQGRDGTFHLFAPSYSEPGIAFALGYTWNAAGVVIPWQSYLQYGDRAILEENYPAMKLHIDGMAGMTEPGRKYLTSHIGFLGDHLSVTDSDPSLMDNAQFLRSVRIVGKAAEILGKDEDAQKYKAYGDGLQKEWNEVFVGEDGRTRDRGGNLQDTQGSYALPLQCGAFSEENRLMAEAHLREACEKTGYTMTTGFMATGPLLPALTEGGYLEAAYEMFEQIGNPSWLYPVVNGATSVWERWSSYTIENGFGGQNWMNSFNHYSLGAVGSWMMEYQAGIQRSGTEGFRKFILQPMPGGHFSSVNAEYDSVYGTIKSAWTAADGKLCSYQAVVPANTEAALYLPVSEAAAETFGEIEGALFEGMEMHLGTLTAKYSLKSGSYSFSVSGT